VGAANRGPPSRQRDIDRSNGGATGFERDSLLVERGLDLALQLVGLTSERRTVVGWRARHVLQERGHCAAFTPQILILQALQIRFGRDRGELRREFRTEMVDGRLGHVEVLSGEC